MNSAEMDVFSVWHNGLTNSSGYAISDRTRETFATNIYFCVGHILQGSTGVLQSTNIRVFTVSVGSY